MSEELMTGDDLLGLCEVFFYRKWVIEKNENQSYKVKCFHLQQI